MFKHENLFSKHPWDCGQVENTEIDLEVKTGIGPFAQKYYPVPQKLVPAARRLISRLLEMQVIEHSYLHTFTA